MNIAEIKERLKRPERTETLCLDADLAAEHEELNRQLENAQRAAAVTMADSGKLAELAQRIRDIEERMTASQVTFRFRSLSGHEKDAWLQAHPAREGKDEAFNLSTGQPALVAACSIDPVITLKDAEDLYADAGVRQFDRLAAAAWAVTFEESGAVPFSVIASATLRATAPKQ